MKEFILNFKTVICIILALTVCLGVLPLKNLVAEASDEERYVIWEANTNTVKANSDGKLNGAMTESGTFADVKKSDDGSGGYITEFTDAGTQAKAVAISSLNSTTINFGWMANMGLLKALSPYVNISFEYKTESTEILPENSRLSIYAAQKANSELCLLAEAPLDTDGQWTKIDRVKILNAINKSWSDGYFTIKISDSNGNLKGTQKVSIKNLYLSVDEADRFNSNAAFKNVAGIKSISNFSAGVYISKDKKRQDDYFKLLIGYDKKSALSTNLSDKTYNITVKQSDNADIVVSQTVAAGSDDGLSSDSVAIYTTLADRYRIRKVNVKKTNGELVQVITSKKDQEFTFTMPASDVEISLDIKYEATRQTALIWNSNLLLESKAPWYCNTSSKPFSNEKVYGADRSAYKITVNQPVGSIMMYGTSNNNITDELYYDTAEFTVSMKLESPNGSGKVSLHNMNVTPSKEVEIGSDWTTVKVPLKEMSSGVLGECYSIDISKLAQGDVLYISDAQVWSRPSGEATQQQMFEAIFDVTGYEKSETNTLIGAFGDPDDRIKPYGSTIIEAEFAWFEEEFQNQSAWYLSKSEDGKFEQSYMLTIPRSGGYLDVSDYEDTGYMEFYVKSKSGIDGLTLPITVQSKNGAAANFIARYDTSKTRDDGYMQFRVPFTYFSDMGVDLGMVNGVYIHGNQSINDVLLLSSFRFYTNYADVPDPEPNKEPEPELERDIPMDIDSNILNAVLDKENKKIFVPDNTYLWELLAAIQLDTDESEVTIFKGRDTILSERDTVIDDSMTLRLYRRGFLVGDFYIYYLTETVSYDASQEGTDSSGDDSTSTSENYEDSESQDTDYDLNQEDEETYDEELDSIPDTGEKDQSLVAIFMVILSGFAVIMLNKKIKKLNI